MSTKTCPKCGEEVEGVDLGDHPQFLTFDCKCGTLWSESVEPKEVNIEQG